MRKKLLLVEAINTGTLFRLQLCTPRAEVKKKEILIWRCYRIMDWP